MKKKKLCVAVLYGGRSGEHEVSIRSARSIMKAMDPARYEILPFRITRGGRWQPHAIRPEPGANPAIDVVFPVLHGTFGEDGTVQGLLELADLPYVGAGVLGSAVSMDKEVTKRLCLERGLPVIEYLLQRRGRLSVREVEERFAYPVFVKPANLGSSVGITKAQNRRALKQALELAASYDTKVIVERAIEGRELECSVLGNEDPLASAPCEIIPSREFYDYEDKYLLDRAQTIAVADLTPAQVQEVQRLSIACYQAVGCEGMARVDFLLEAATGRLYLSEINTIPGFTSISMYPKMWEAAGLPYPRLIDRLIELALERHRVRRKTRFRR